MIEFFVPSRDYIKPRRDAVKLFTTYGCLDCARHERISG